LAVRYTGGVHFAKALAVQPRNLYALLTPDTAKKLAQADADYAAGSTVSGEEIRRRYGLRCVSRMLRGQFSNR